MEEFNQFCECHFDRENTMLKHMKNTRQIVPSSLLQTTNQYSQMRDTTIYAIVFIIKNWRADVASGILYMCACIPSSRDANKDDVSPNRMAHEFVLITHFIYTPLASRGISPDRGNGNMRGSF